jgi:mannose-6-phosphate isomerase-like protein (cupin superfamily)
MIIRKNQMRKEIRNQMRGGTGDVELTFYIEKEHLKNARLMSNIRIKPQDSIGYHEHKEETEYFIIINGTGLVNDNGTETSVEKGDIIVTGNGASHSIKNTGADTLELVAIIINN